MGAAVVMEAVVAVVVVNKGNEERPGGDGKGGEWRKRKRDVGSFAVKPQITSRITEHWIASIPVHACQVHSELP